MIRAQVDPWADMVGSQNDRDRANASKREIASDDGLKRKACMSEGRAGTGD